MGEVECDPEHPQRFTLIVRTDEGQPRPKYIFNKCGTNIYFFTLQRFGPSPSPNFISETGCSKLKQDVRNQEQLARNLE